MAEHSSYELVVELLNQASLEHSASAKVILLKQVQELVINKEPNLLDNFFDEVIGFQSDKSVDVRKFVITFFEHACKVDGDILSKIIGNLNILLYDENVNIKKKVMLSMGSLYRTAIKWILQAKIVTEVMEETWKYLSQMKNHIVSLIDDDNDGIRTHSVKFCEAIVLALSPKTVDSEVKDDDQSLDIVPDSDGFLKKKKLEEDGKRIFKQMMDFLGSQSITSMNLMACMTSMTSIARKRPQYIMDVIEGFESLHVNLPPTLANSQVSSVRKSLKLQMLSLLKHPAAASMIPQIATLLTDLGATQAEVSRNMPKPSEVAASRKRRADSEAELQRSKKLAKTEMPALPTMPDVEDEEDDALAAKADKSKPLNPVDITTEDIIPKLYNSNVADLVLLSMVMLPDEMPAHFQSTYTPIAAAGTPGQIKHISRLLAVQLTNAGLGKGIEEQREKEKEEALAKMDVPETPVDSAIEVVGRDNSNQAKAQFIVPLSGTTTRKSKAYDLMSVTKSLSLPISTNLMIMSVQRIYKAEGDASKANLNAAFCKILSGLTTQFGGSLRSMLFDFILSDTRNRGDLALAWVYSEYVAYQGFTLSPGVDKPSQQSYEDCVSGLLRGLLSKKDQPGASQLFSRLVLESPRLPIPAIDTLKLYCTDDKHMYLGMHMLSELILKRPVLLTSALYALLDFSYHEKAEVRNTAIQVIKDLYDNPNLAHLIDEFCKEMIRHLLSPKPTHSMFPATDKFKSGLDSQQQPWSENYIKQTLYLYLSILPDNHSYIELLAEVYVKATSDIKRVILRLMEAPIKQLGMHSPQLLAFIKVSPKGSETLITRIIHILTERQAPSPELVDIVKVLYQERVADVRFLIPVLGGLVKSEIVAALPRLIKLSPPIVKEVFNRLMGVGGHAGQEAALTPSELLVALHHIDPSQCEIKTVIKATTMCFQEKSLFTQEVLAVVIQQLMDVNPLPTLFMRTVIQSLATYSKLLGFVLHILQRLITKQVWKQKKIWDGFIRCCQRTKPQSFQVLLQLAPPQLKMAFETAPELRQPLLKHINSFSAHQRAHIPKAVLAVIEQKDAAQPEVKVAGESEAMEAASAPEPADSIEQESGSAEERNNSLSVDSNAATLERVSDSKDNSTSSIAVAATVATAAADNAENAASQKQGATSEPMDTMSSQSADGASSQSADGASSQSADGASVDDQLKTTSVPAASKVDDTSENEKFLATGKGTNVDEGILGDEGTLGDECANVEKSSVDEGTLGDEGAHDDESANVEESTVGEGAHGEGSNVEESTVGEGAHGEGSNVEESTVGEDAHGEGSNVEESADVEGTHGEGSADVEGAHGEGSADVDEVADVEAADEAEKEEGSPSKAPSKRGRKKQTSPASAVTRKSSRRKR